MPKRKSRAARYQEALELIGRGRDQIEELRDELQDWLDGMPENLQESSKAEQLQEAIDELDTMAENAIEIEETAVEFPGMFG